MFQAKVFIPLALFVAAASMPASAATDAEIDALYKIIGTPQLIEIMRIEGLDQAEELHASMFPGRGGWDAIASSIYDTDRMAATFRTEFGAVLAPADVETLLAFFASDPGTRIVGLELSAREALLDEDVKKAAQEAFEALPGDDPERAALLEEFVSANDLIELNVMGALNASLAFYTGLSDGGGFEMTESDMLREVWSQVPGVRAETESWIYSYAALAYQPLTDDEIEDYTALSRTPPGRDLNRALFAGFDAVFNEISLSLGLAASQFAQGDDI
ncbi:MAG: DUF2059 domain-containing protein [Boseongicola sp.]